MIWCVNGVISKNIFSDNIIYYVEYQSFWHILIISAALYQLLLLLYESIWFSILKTYKYNIFCIFDLLVLFSYCHGMGHINFHFFEFTTDDKKHILSFIHTLKIKIELREKNIYMIISQKIYIIVFGVFTS